MTCICYINDSIKLQKRFYHCMHPNLEFKVIVAEDVLKVISDKESLELFKLVALTKRNNSNYNTNALMSKTKLTSEQYYSRLSTLSNAGLITIISSQDITKPLKVHKKH